MKKYEVAINNDYDKLLGKIAKQNDVGPEAYVSGIVNSWLESQYRGQIFEKLKKKTIDELINLNL